MSKEPPEWQEWINSLSKKSNFSRLKFLILFPDLWCHVIEIVWHQSTWLLFAKIITNFLWNSCKPLIKFFTNFLWSLSSYNLLTNLQIKLLQFSSELLITHKPITNFFKTYQKHHINFLWSYYNLLTKV